MKVLFLPEVRQYMKEIMQALYDKEYFGQRESAERYVEELLYDITTTLHLRVKKPAPAYFERYGQKMLYAVFRKNRSTQWYVFFNVYRDGGETVYLVRYIANNHVIAHRL